MIIHKATGILSVRSRFHRSVPEENILDQVGNLLPVHRLDREVEGLILAAKTSRAQSIANQWFEKKEIRKTYWALSCEVELAVFDKLPFRPQRIEAGVGSRFHWQSRLLRGKKRSYESEHGDRAETEAQVLSVHNLQGNSLFHWELHPLTGRAHQLRFELAKHHHPVLGDELYFAPLAPTYAPGIALIAHKLDFSRCTQREALGLPENFALDLSAADFIARARLSSTPVADKE